MALTPGQVIKTQDSEIIILSEPKDGKVKALVTSGGRTRQTEIAVSGQ